MERLSRNPRYLPGRFLIRRKEASPRLDDILQVEGMMVFFFLTQIREREALPILPCSEGYLDIGRLRSLIISVFPRGGGDINFRPSHTHTHTHTHTHKHKHTHTYPVSPGVVNPGF